MFVANSSFENHFLSGIGSSGDRYYRAFELSGRSTWFIVTCVVQNEELEMLRSVCCASEEDLLGLLQPMTAESFRDWWLRCKAEAMSEWTTAAYWKGAISGNFLHRCGHARTRHLPTSGLQTNAQPHGRC